MEFMLVSTGMIVLVVVVLVLLGRAYPGSGADLVDWKPTRSYEDEAQPGGRRRPPDDGRAERDAPPPGRRRDDLDDLDRMVAEDEDVRARARPEMTGPEPEPELSDDGEGSRPA